MMTQICFIMLTWDVANKSNRQNTPEHRGTVLSKHPLKLAALEFQMIFTELSYNLDSSS